MANCVVCLVLRRSRLGHSFSYKFNSLMDRKCFVLFFNNACSYLSSTFQCHFYTFSLPPFFPVTWLVVLFFLLLTAFFTNMVRCYIRTPLKLTFLNSVTFFLPIFLTSFDASGLIIKYWHGHRPYASVSILEEVSRSWYDLKKLTSKTKTLLLVYTREHAYFILF